MTRKMLILSTSSQLSGHHACQTLSRGQRSDTSYDLSFLIELCFRFWIFMSLINGPRWDLRLIAFWSITHSGHVWESLLDLRSWEYISIQDNNASFTKPRGPVFGENGIYWWPDWESDRRPPVRAYSCYINEIVILSPPKVASSRLHCMTFQVCGLWGPWVHWVILVEVLT